MKSTHIAGLASPTRSAFCWLKLVVYSDVKEAPLLHLNNFTTLSANGSKASSDHSTSFRHHPWTLLRIFATPGRPKTISYAVLKP